MSFPADELSWDEVVLKSYNLIKKEIQTDNKHIRLFKTRRNAPFYTNAPYLEVGGINEQNDDFSQNMTDQIFNICEKENLNYLLLKTLNSNVPQKNNIIIDSNFYTFLLNLEPGTNTLWEKVINGKTRNQIRKGEKNSFLIKFGNIELLDDFYKVISQCWRDLGTPTHHYLFYKLILEHFNEKTSLCVIYDKDTPVSTALLFILNNTLHHPFAGTLRKYRASCVNNVLYWNIIKYAIENSATMFDMGRSRENSGTYKFKKSWGAIPKQLYYYYFMNKAIKIPDYNSRFYTIATNSWKFMPVPVANWLGPKLIRNII